jgi:hypothetical protein
MVRTIKAKAPRSLKKEEQAVLLPGATEAEPWELWFMGKTQVEYVQGLSLPAENRWRKTTTLALPIAQVFCLPLWLNETDPKQFPGMIPLQLEMRGLLPRNAGTAIFDWSIVSREGSRTLVIVGILPGFLPDEIEAETHGIFDLSVRYFPLAENALTLWQERDRLVFAITRGPNLVYFHALTDSRISSRVLQDLNCVRATLAMQGVITSLERIIVWAEATPAERAALQEALQLPVQPADKPNPQLPQASWKLVPASVSNVKKERETRRWQVRAGLIALAFYLVVVGWLLSRLFVENVKVQELQRWQTDHATALALVDDTRAAWNDLRPVVDEQSYPLELLLHASQAIPPDQLHLTLFESSADGHLLIKGEGKDVAAAFQFLDRLKRDPAFSSYTWDMAQPHLLPNDLAQLQIEGSRGPGDF